MRFDVLQYMRILLAGRSDEMKNERQEQNRKLKEWLYGPWDESRCRICGWPLVADMREGCTAESCSLRPAPERRADEPQDFFTSEAANAQLRRKIRETI